LEGGAKAEKLAKLRDLLSAKSAEFLDTSRGSKEESKLLQEIDAAKSKNAELSNKLKQKKQELSSMMTKRQSEIEELSKQVDESNNDQDSDYDDGKEDNSLEQGSLRERLSKLSALRGLISQEMKERNRLEQEIQRLEEKGQASDKGAEVKYLKVLKDLLPRDQILLKKLCPKTAKFQARHMMGRVWP
jgi:chromosome segregation ATPase